MTLTYFNDINVYFHMKNHYKMLKHVKSVVDTSIPQSLLKSPIAMNNNLDKRMKAATNEHLRQIYNITDQNHTTKRRGPVKKHSCLKTTKSEASLKTEYSSKPTIRRNSSTAPDRPLFPNSYSMVPSKFEKMFRFKQRKRSSTNSASTNNSDIQNVTTQLDLQHTETPSNSARSNVSEAKYSTKSEPSFPSENKLAIPKSSEEHEYLLFLLRITEDIISNDFYSNKDIKRIFEAHIELNKNRLNMKKMHLHIANLCKELNIDCQEFKEKFPILDESDSPKNFHISPDSQNYVLNNDAFKSCQDCSVIRSSSLYKMYSELEGCCALGDSLGGEAFVENIGDCASISPNLFKLLEKLSLGRVTECTEPAASTSTIVSPRPNISTFNDTEPNEIDNFKESHGEPLDFETFVKELNSKESVLPEEHTDLTPSENGLLATDLPTVKDNKEPLKNVSSNVNTEISHQNLELPKEFSENSKSFVELTEKETDGNTSSEKYQSEFEKCSSNNSLIISAYKTEKPEELTIKSVDNPVKENMSQSKMDNELEKASELKDQLVKSSSKIPILIKPEKSSQTCSKNEKIDEISSTESSITRKVSTSSPSKYPSNVQNLEETENNKTDQLSDKSILPAKEDDEISQNHSLKIILQGAVKDDDYIMVKGPVYVYKPLLESEPKLIIFAENDKDEKSRRNSMESQNSHKTFTVDHSPVLDQLSADQAIQCDASLRSVNRNNSMENILELTKTTYSQFVDNYKLLQSDYDLTPERDGSDNKYHHLLMDAATSISGVNITENLLLTDDYLVKNDIDIRQFTNKSALNNDTKNVESDFSDYIKLEPKMFENNYVINRKLISSASMPKLCSNIDRSYGGRNNELTKANVLKKCSSNLIDFDVPSQDSSLRSEGEALHNYDCSRNGIAWTLYYPRK